MTPAAAGLRRQGASRGATAAFLVSTPETGVDSIAVTYALLGPAMSIVRPLVAVATALLAGFWVNYTPDDMPQNGTWCVVCGRDPCACEPGAATENYLLRVFQGLRFAFVNLLGDIGGWFLFGIVIAGVISAVLPDDLLATLPGGRVAPLVLMLLVGMPMYVCATASTPIAAALALKGLSPGAVLVFLLAGPATNAASLAVVTRIIGRRGTAAYLTTIAGCALLAGAVLDTVCALAGWRLVGARMAAHDGMYGGVGLVCALVLLVLIAAAALRRVRAHA